MAHQTPQVSDIYRCQLNFVTIGNSTISQGLSVDIQSRIS